MPDVTPEVAVSYAWKEENGGANAQAVETLCTNLRQKGIKVLRDKEGLKLGDDIREFITRIGSSRYLCVFLSDAYLRSPNCMNELLIAWDQSKGKPEEFRGRVRVWIMESAKEIYKTDGRIKYTAYWKAECERLQKLLQDHMKEISGPELEILKLHRQYAEKVNEILFFFATKLSPRAFDEFEEWVCSELIKNCPAEPSTPTLPAVLPPPNGTKSHTEAGATNPAISPTASTPSGTTTDVLSSATPSNDAEDCKRVRNVFGPLFARLEAILQKYPALHRALEARYKTPTAPIGDSAARLICRFHEDFLVAMGFFAQIYEDSGINREILVELVSTVMYLSMRPEFANALLKDTKSPKTEGSTPRSFEVAEEARQGIDEMLLCWTRRKARNEGRGKNSQLKKNLSPSPRHEWV